MEIFPLDHKLHNLKPEIFRVYHGLNPEIFPGYHDLKHKMFWVYHGRRAARSKREIFPFYRRRQASENFLPCFGPVRLVFPKKPGKKAYRTYTVYFLPPSKNGGAILGRVFPFRCLRRHAISKGKFFPLPSYSTMIRVIHGPS